MYIYRYLHPASGVVAPAHVIEPVRELVPQHAPHRT